MFDRIYSRFVIVASIVIVACVAWGVVGFVHAQVNNGSPIGLDVLSTGAYGNKSAIGTSAVQMVSASNPAIKGILIKADPSNTGKVAVGLSSGVTYNTTDATDGVVLNAGESITIPVNNANLIYVIGSATTQRVGWMAL